MVCISFDYLLSKELTIQHFKSFKVPPICIFFISKLISTIQRIRLYNASEYCINIKYKFLFLQNIFCEAVLKTNITPLKSFHWEYYYYYFKCK